jgi:acetylornithine/succinyldiaminopimelate/putrescine aminotransferase
MPSGFTHVPPNSITALKLAAGPRTAAVLIEPIQGEGGVRPVSDEFLLAAREICDRLGALLMFDEVQVGMGRTGTLFAYEQTPVVPDVICLAKALGNGFPIGAMLAKEEVMSHLPPGSHASTFGGNPVACAAAKVVIETLTSPGFLDRVKETGTYLNTGLESLADKYSEKILEVRGRGLIQAIEFREPVPELANKLMDKGFLVLLTQGKILRLVPPLIVTKAEINAMLNAIENNI